MRRTIGELLEVLLAEVGAAPAGGGEELDHDRADPLEVPRTRGPFPPSGEARAPTPGWRGACGHSGYISSTAGANTTSAPVVAAIATSASRSRG